MEVIDPTVEDALIEALRPRSGAEAMRLRLTGGLPLNRILDRLPADFRASLLPDEGEVARQQAFRQLRAGLGELEAAGRVRRSRRELTVDTRGHGVRNGVVDVWRLRLRGGR